MKTTHHHPPIYGGKIVQTPRGAAIETWTANSRGVMTHEGHPHYYTMRVNIVTGAASCTCEGFQSAIVKKCRDLRTTPNIANSSTLCKHLRKNAAYIVERGFMPVGLVQVDNTTGAALDRVDDLRDAVPAYPDADDNIYDAPRIAPRNRVPRRQSEPIISDEFRARLTDPNRVQVDYAALFLED